MQICSSPYAIAQSYSQQIDWVYCVAGHTSTVLDAACECIANSHRSGRLDCIWDCVLVTLGVVLLFETAPLFLNLPAVL